MNWVRYILGQLRVVLIQILIPLFPTGGHGLDI